MKIITRLLFALILLGGVVAQAAELKVDLSKSSIVTEVKASPPHSFEVILKDYTVSAAIDETAALTAANLSFRFVDLNSDNGSRDKKMFSWMDTETNPDVSFVMTESIVRDGKMVAKGNLTMHGIRRAIEIPYSVSMVNGGVVLDGTAQIDHRDWNLEIIKLLIFKVKPSLVVRIHIEGTLT